MGRGALQAFVLLLFASVAGFGQVVYDGNNNLPPFGSFSGSDFDVVSLQNGNLHIHIPILEVPQRGGKPIKYFYFFDTPDCLWTLHQPGHNDPQSSWAVGCGRRGWGLSSSLDWSVGQQKSISVTCSGFGTPFNEFTYSLTDPEGTSHPLGLVYASGAPCAPAHLRSSTMDGSGAFVTLDSGGTVTSVLLKDGTQPSLANSEDTNGNLITVSSGTLAKHSGAMPGSDTLNRMPLTVTGSAPNPQTWTYTDSNGTTQTWTVTYTTISLEKACGSNTTSCTDLTLSAVVPQSLQLPTGRAYTLKWNNNSLDELQEIDLPTGGAISYTYQFGCQTNPDSTTTTQDCRMRVKTRTVTQNGTSATWTYNLSDNLPTGTGTVTDPYGNDEVHTFSDLGTGGGSTFETQVQYWNGSSASGAGGTVLKTVFKKYAVGGANNLLTPNGVSARLIEEDTTLEDGSERMTQTDYETYTEWWGTATRMNPTAQREYDYGAPNSGSAGPLMRQTTYTYLHTGNSAYTNANIVDRVATTIVKDGAGNQLAETINEYDNYSHPNQPMVASGAIQHDANFSTSNTLRGNVTAVKHWRNTDGAFLTTTNQYDDAGNVISSIDPLGNKTSFDYTDAWANTTCAPTGAGKAYLTTTTNALSQVRRHTYNSCNGTLASTTDENSQTTTFTFDLMGRHVQTNSPDGGQTSLCYSDTSSGTCYSASTPLTTTRNEKISSSPALSRTDVNVYDDLGRLMETDLTSDPGGTTYTRTSYDLVGRKSQEWNPTRCDPFANPSSCSGETTFGVTTYNYDALGRTVQVIPPDGTSTANFEGTSYSGRSTTVTDQAGHARKSQTDGLGRLTNVWEDPAGLNYPTIYQYDVLGNMLCVEQHGSAATGTGCSSAPSNDATSPWRVRRFTYNSLSQLLTASNPESGTITYAYDNDGNVATKTAPAANQTGTATVTTTYGYDVLNRLTGKSYNDGKTLPVDYAYDGNTLSGCPAQPPPGDIDSNPIGYRTSMCDASGATNWIHDVMGRIKSERRTIGAAAGKFDTDVYNLDGSIANLTVPGYSIAYTYSRAQRPLTATNFNTPETKFVTAASYAPFGGVTSATWGAGTTAITITDSYNSRLQPTTLSAATSAATIMSLSYDFHLGTADNGNVYQIVNNRNGNRTQNFLYDSLNRISQAYTNGPNWGETFTIDAWGNLTNKGSVSGKTLSEGLNAAPASVKNQLNGYCHDAAGNLVLNAPCPTGTLFPTYTYDAENRLVATAGMTYVYDGDGKRVIKCAGTYPTCSSGMAYWRGWTNQVSAETDLAGNLVENYIFFGGQRIARRDANGTIHYYFSDHLGTHSLITDVNGTMPPQSESDFYPYGGEITVTSGDTNRYKFTGKERDGESGLDHFGARYYSSATGRFTTVDPINMKLNRVLDPQRLALYSHARNAPNVWTDTDGKDLKLATGQSPTDANQVIGLLATQYQTESGRRAINAADKSAIHNTVGNVSIPDRNPPVVTYGQNVTKPNDLGNPPDPNKVDPSKTTNAIQLDINKMAAHGADMDAKTKHELSHTEDINTDLKGFVKDYLTSKSAGTEMASERKAEAAEDAPNEPATMDYQSAEYNVRAILGEPTDAPIDSTVQGAPREEDSEGGKQQ